MFCFAWCLYCRRAAENKIETSYTKPEAIKRSHTIPGAESTQNQEQNPVFCFAACLL